MRKRFEVDSESSISFDGDPMTHCNMNINAKYQTTASLSDLLESSVTSYLNSNIVKVDCIANITGPLLQPIIKFDIKSKKIQLIIEFAVILFFIIRRLILGGRVPSDVTFIPLISVVFIINFIILTLTLII